MTQNPDIGIYHIPHLWEKIPQGLIHSTDFSSISSDRNLSFSELTDPQSYSLLIREPIFYIFIRDTVSGMHVSHAYSQVLSDTYEAGLVDKTTMADGKDKTGPALLELVVQPFFYIYCEPQWEKILNEKCASYPRPANARMLKVPKLNNWLEEITTKECKENDQDLQNLQSYMIASMSAIAGQAQTLLELEQWAMNSIHAGISSKTQTFAKCYASLMDANLLMTRVMYGTNQFRRVLIKQGMADSLMELLLNNNKPSPEWLAGGDANVDMVGVKETVMGNEAIEIIPTKYKPHNSDQLKSYANIVPVKGAEMLCSSKDNDTKEDVESLAPNTELNGSLEFKMQLNDSAIKSQLFKGITSCEPQTDDLHMPFNSRESKDVATGTAGKKYLLPDHFCKIEQDNSDSDGVEDTSQDSKPEDNIATDMCQARSVDFVQPADEIIQLKTHTDEKLVCYDCGKEFVTISRLKKHMLIHTRQKPHACADCDKSFNWPSDLKRHMKTHTGVKPKQSNNLKKSGVRTHTGVKPNLKTVSVSHMQIHTEKRLHLCADCGKSFKQSNHLKRHMKTHTDVKPAVKTVSVVKLSKKGTYKCTDCDKTFNSSGNLGIHRRVHTGEKPYMCSECGRAFSQSGALKSHMRLHTGEKPFVCSDCGKRFTSLAALSPHIVSCNRAGGPDVVKKERPRNHICNECGKAFYRKCTLKIHALYHSGEKPHICSLCHKRFVAKGDLTEHMNTHTGLKPHKCSQCGKAFNSVKKRRVHMQTHTKPHTCSICGKGFTMMESLLKHNELQECNAKVSMNTNTGEKPYVCSDCGKRFRIWRHLKAHLTIHTGTRSYLCSECGKGFHRKPTLEIHMWTHTAERPFKCKVCGKGFILATVLKSHMRKHTGEKAYLCFECGKGFTNSSSFKRHMQIHKRGKPVDCSDSGTEGRTIPDHLDGHIPTQSGKTPYICSECGQKFSVASNLNVHLKTHSRPKCHICGKEFNQISKLNLHILLHVTEGDDA